MKEIFYYKLSNGKYPYKEWYKNLDNSVKIKIDKRLEKLEEGHYGDYKRFDNIVELRFKQGYRIYFTEYENIIVVLLCAGDKKTQKNDIKKAKEYMENLKGL